LQPTNTTPAHRTASVWIALLASLVVLGGIAPASQGETTPTAQASADDGAFLSYAPPPAQRAGLCLVDTGVNTNPDTEGTVVDRVAIDGSSGADTSPTEHGTVLAMMAAAPLNGWGTLGTAPGAIQLVSVGILEAGMTTVSFSAYSAGITGCLRVRQQYDIRVINLSLGSPEAPSSQEAKALTSEIERATNYGVAVVAAAGNDDGGAVEYPAASPGVLSVGATDTQGGAFCSFSNRGTGLRLLAPGCELDAAEPNTGTSDFNYWQGTSEASAITASALTALMAFRPDLTPTAAEETLTGADNSALNIAQAFRNAGLTTIVTAGEATQLNSTKQPTSAGPPGNMASKAMLSAPYPRPSARLQRLRGRLDLILKGKPSGAQVEVRYLGHPEHSRRLRVLRTIHGTFTRLQLPRFRLLEVSLRYLDPYDHGRTSPWATLKVPPWLLPQGHR
jgi:hypothetical protein